MPICEASERDSNWHTPNNILANHNLCDCQYFSCWIQYSPYYFMTSLKCTFYTFSGVIKLFPNKHKIVMYRCLHLKCKLVCQLCCCKGRTNKTKECNWTKQFWVYAAFCYTQQGKFLWSIFVLHSVIIHVFILNEKLKGNTSPAFGWAKFNYWWN